MIEPEFTADDEDKSSSSSSGRGKRRSNVYIKSRFGTTCIPPDRKCDICDGRSIGVVALTDREMGDYMVVCSRHESTALDKMGYEERDEDYEFKKFID